MTFIIMEYCSQGDLFRTVFLRGGSVDEEWAVRKIIAPMLQVLSRLHRENILHRYGIAVLDFLNATPRPLCDNHC